MTAQVMDTIRFDDQDWAISEWNGPPAPTSESLGFSTEEESTANYSGRVDHYVVEKVSERTREHEPPPAPRFQLRLARIDANLTKESAGFIPPPPYGAREDIVRRAWVEQFLDIAALFRKGAPAATKSVLDTQKSVVLVFHKLWVPFTGTIVGGRAFDQTRYVHMGTQASSSFGVRLHLTFRDGVLTDHRVDREAETGTLA